MDFIGWWQSVVVSIVWHWCLPCGETNYCWWYFYYRNVHEVVAGIESWWWPIAIGVDDTTSAVWCWWWWWRTVREGGANRPTIVPFLHYTKLHHAALLGTALFTGLVLTTLRLLRRDLWSVHTSTPDLSIISHQERGWGRYCFRGFRWQWHTPVSRYPDCREKVH